MEDQIKTITDRTGKNIAFNLAEIWVTAILGMISRYFMIKYLGVEILGVNATVAETVNLLSMSEGGVSAAVSYKMYGAVSHGDEKRQQELFGLYRSAYRIIGCSILILGLCVIPFLHKIIKSEIPLSIVYWAYVLTLLVVVLRYLLLYYGILLNVWGKQYVIKRFSFVVNSVIVAIQILIMVLTKNYLLYVSVGFLSLIANYVFLRKYSKKNYFSIIVPCKSKKEDVSELYRNLKKLIIGQISSYIYGSTDNVLVSSIFGTIIVGYISNYKVITNIVRTVITAITTAITPSWGVVMNSTINRDRRRKFYSVCNFCEYAIAFILVVPTYVLVDDFIQLWLGREFLFDRTVIFLICLELFLAFLLQPPTIVIGVMGMFGRERDASVVAAIVNIVFSLLLAYIVGVKGIFIGTIIADLWYLIYRSYYVNKEVLDGKTKSYFVYWKNNCLYILTFTVSVFLFERTVGEYCIKVSIITFILKGFVIELGCIVIILAVGAITRNLIESYNIMKSLINAKRKHD